MFKPFISMALVNFLLLAQVFPEFIFPKLQTDWREMCSLVNMCYISDEKEILYVCLSLPQVHPEGAPQGPHRERAPQAWRERPGGHG